MNYWAYEHFDAEEKKHLKPYQVSDYKYATNYINRKSDKTGLISWSGNKYSVPLLYQNAYVGVK